MDDREVAKYFSETVDWDEFFSFVDCIGASLNRSKDRFYKSDFIEMALAKFSNEKIVYINDNGKDHFIPELNVYVEMKHNNTALYSENGKSKKFVTLTLMNTMGMKDYTTLPDDYADYIIVTSMNGSAIVSKETAKKYLVMTKDQINAKIPFHEFVSIRAPQEIHQNNLARCDFKELIGKFLGYAIDKFDTSYQKAITDDLFGMDKYLK